MYRFPLFLAACCVLSLWYDLAAQPASAEYALSFSTSGSIENVIGLDMPRRQYREVRKAKGEKFDLDKVKFTINGKVLEVKSVGLHGNSTLDFPRKSYSVSLKDSAHFQHKGSARAVRKFQLLSLSMDEYYYRNRLAFGCLQRMGLFPLFFSYAELRINGESQGIYMVVQKPHEYAMKEQEAPALLRRHYYNEIKKTKVEEELTPFGKKDYARVFEHMYAMAKDYQQAGLYDSLNRCMDMQAYLRWMGFNYFVCNGDYTDELYFYALPGIDSIRFGIIPWDYDDIFAEEPHEGEFVRDRLIGDRLVFSAEDALDRGIARNPKAYAHYLEELAWVNTHFSPDSLRELFEETFEELYPYYNSPEIIAASSLDPKGKVDLEGLKVEMEMRYRFLAGRYQQIRELPKE